MKRPVFISSETKSSTEQEDIVGQVQQQTFAIRTFLRLRTAHFSLSLSHHGKCEICSVMPTLTSHRILYNSKPLY